MALDTRRNNFRVDCPGSLKAATGQTQLHATAQYMMSVFCRSYSIIQVLPNWNCLQPWLLVQINVLLLWCNDLFQYYLTCRFYCHIENIVTTILQFQGRPSRKKVGRIKPRPAVPYHTLPGQAYHIYTFIQQFFPLRSAWRDIFHLPSPRILLSCPVWLRHLFFWVAYRGIVISWGKIIP